MLATGTLLLIGRPSELHAAPYRVAIFVNGSLDCCAYEMYGVQDRYKELGIQVYTSPWNSLSMISGNDSENQSPKTTTGATDNFISQMKTYFSSLPTGSEVFLIGHSFGGDSILRFLQGYNQTRIKIRLVAVIDSVTFGGIRSTSYGPLKNVEYLFNRWQTNQPWPINFFISGEVPCSAQTCGDQDEQNFSRLPDGSARKVTCGWEEVTCEGYIPFKRRGTKSRRVQHQQLAYDPYVQQQIMDITDRLISSQREERKADADIIRGIYNAIYQLVFYQFKQQMGAAIQWFL
jgi:hypothetical protein